LTSVDTWGRDHVSMSVGAAGAGGPNLVRIVAAYDGTEIAITPPQGGTSALSLDAGEFAELTVDGIFRIVGTKPIQVAQYLFGQGVGSSAAFRGDPSMWIVPPIEQLRREYAVNIPGSYNTETHGQNYLLVVRPRDTWTAIDQVGGPPFDAEVGEWEAGVVRIAPSVHTVLGEREIGVIAIGLSDYTSYATPAGRGLTPLVF
jgi:hypothetical protein